MTATLKPRYLVYTTVLAVTRLNSDIVDSVAIESEEHAHARYNVGDRIWIAGLAGFPESRLTMGRVRDVKHTIGSELSASGVRLLHTTTVYVDEIEEEQRT